MKRIELVERIKKAIESETCLKKNRGNSYIGELCFDEQDMWVEDVATLTELCEKGEDAVYEYIMNCYSNMDSDIDDYYNFVKSEVKYTFTDKELEEYEDDIDEFIDKNVDFIFSEDFIWGTKFLVNIVLCGEAGCIYRDEEGKYRVEDGVIKWLIEQQGHKIEEFENELNAEGVPFENNFFKSVYEELNNTVSFSNSLTVSVVMTLREFMDLKKSHEQNKLKVLDIDRGCSIGLVNFWQGCGSLLDIQLEKDLEILGEDIQSICPDISLEYGIGSIYGNDYHNFSTYLDYEVI